MRSITPKRILSELHRTTVWQPDASRSPIEHLVEYILTGTRTSQAIPDLEKLADRILRLDLKATHAVVIGGGTGLSTIIGGNSQMPDWPDHPMEGIKQYFPQLTSIVCTTDDGGSTGQLLKLFPLIGVGDIRKLLISSIQPLKLQRLYNLDTDQSAALVRMIHRLFNHRFDKETPGIRDLSNPLLAIPAPLRQACPRLLADALGALGTYVSPGNAGPAIPLPGHAVGNLLLVAAIFRESGPNGHRPPGMRTLQRGIDHIASLIGAPVGRILPATATPGQLKYRYANGVEVYGQSKSARFRRDSPVDRVTTEFARPPLVSAAVRKAIAEADVIIYAPGSLYSSILPVLQLNPIVDAIRANQRALKILCANFWMQEGETDISLKNQGRGFLVSELVEACDRNIRHGNKGLFDIVLSPNLEHIPGNILRNYALEGKSPIHLDREHVEALGVHAVEATLFSQEQQTRAKIIQHDPRRIALAIRTLIYADRYLKKTQGYCLRGSAARKKVYAGAEEPLSSPQGCSRKPFLCQYLESIKGCLRTREFHPPALRDFFLNLVWENRDIQPSHLAFFQGARILSGKQWSRDTQWDNVLGYFDPEDGYLKLHQDLLANPARLAEDLLIALGESLLGRYIEKRRWIQQNGSRRYEIVLKSPDNLHSYLSDAQLQTYLQLARMIPDPANNRIYGITINKNGGFLPPGLLFGLLYAWYLSGKGLTMEYEMTLLRWPLKSLIPLHAQDRTRKEALVRFFRTQIFGHEK